MSVAGARCSGLLYVGTYTTGESNGIYAFRFSAERGELMRIGLAAATANPSYLALHPNKPFLYAVSEVKTHQGEPTGLASAYSVDPASGRLTLVNRAPSLGPGPCHISLDRTGEFAIVSNYVGGSVAVLRISEDGGFGKATAMVQHAGCAGTRPHAHGAFFSPDNGIVIVPDLGLDKLFVYRLHAEQGTLDPAEPPVTDLPPGAGPRHVAFHPSGACVYVVNERNSTITSFEFNSATGSLRPFQTITTLPAGYCGCNAAAAVKTDREGLFLYASNRGADCIAVSAAGPDGALEPIEHAPTGGKTPRDFAIDPTGTCLLAANQDSGAIVVFRRDRSSGRLSPAGAQVELEAPACMVFVPRP